MINKTYNSLELNLLFPTKLHFLGLDLYFLANLYILLVKLYYHGCQCYEVHSFECSFMTCNELDIILNLTLVHL